MMSSNTEWIAGNLGKKNKKRAIQFIKSINDAELVDTAERRHQEFLVFIEMIRAQSKKYTDPADSIDMEKFDREK